jgi:hypothetical protein
MHRCEGDFDDFCLAKFAEKIVEEKIENWINNYKGRVGIN